MEEWSKCQHTIGELRSIIHQQKTEIIDMKRRIQASGNRRRHISAAEEFINCAVSDLNELKTDTKTEESENRDHKDNGMQDKIFINKYRRNHGRLKSGDMHYISRIHVSWLRDEVEDLLELCRDLQARLRCIFETLDDKHEVRLKERQFDEVQ